MSSFIETFTALNFAYAALVRHERRDEDIEQPACLRQLEAQGQRVLFSPVEAVADGVLVQAFSGVHAGESAPVIVLTVSPITVTSILELPIPFSKS